MLLLLTLVDASCFAPYNDNPWDVPEAAPRNLTYCRHYNKLTCCTPDGRGIAANFDDDVCGAPSSNCLDQWTLYLCRFCTPHYSNYLNYWQKLKVCADFAERLYGACSSSSIQHASTAGAVCVRVDQRWKNAKDFIENVFDNEYVDGSDQSTCFNAANRTFHRNNIGLLLALSSLLLLPTLLML
jgi:hypothetical protein